MAGEGSNNEVSESGPLLTVHARAQAVSDTVTTSVYISDFEISKDGVGRTVEGATHAFQITVDTQNVDTVALNAAITQAQGKLDATKKVQQSVRIQLQREQPCRQLSAVLKRLLTAHHRKIKWMQR